MKDKLIYTGAALSLALTTAGGVYLIYFPDQAAPFGVGFVTALALGLCLVGPVVAALWEQIP